MLAHLFRELDAFHPTLVGTFPLGLQVEGSDLDIVCACAELDSFERSVRDVVTALGIADVRVERLAVPAAVVVAFSWEGTAIEVFGEVRDVSAQAGFRHLMIEGQLLVCGGRALRDRVRALKRAGAKTEPAFARVLGLAGDPYAALLELERWPPERMQRLVARALGPDSTPAIAAYEGDRRDLLPLFRLADDSEQAIAGYLDAGEILVAMAGGRVIGHVQILEAGTWQINSVAVAEPQRGRALGRGLVEAGVEHARCRGARAIEVATAAADVGLLRFYQRLGFRMARVERDVFTPEAGYPAELFVDGVRLLDRVWLARSLP